MCGTGCLTSVLPQGTDCVRDGVFNFCVTSGNRLCAGRGV